MPITNLFAQHLLPTTDPQTAINDLATLIDAEPSADGTETYYNVDGNDIRGFFDNDNFYITGINNFTAENKIQFDY